MKTRRRGTSSPFAAAAFLAVGLAVSFSAVSTLSVTPALAAPPKKPTKRGVAPARGSADVGAKQADGAAPSAGDRDVEKEKEPLVPADAAKSDGPRTDSAKAKAAPDDPPKESTSNDPTTNARPTEESGPGSKPEIKANPEVLAIGAPQSEDEASPEGGSLKVHPYFLVVGGLKADFVKEKPGDTKNDRVSTYALARFGFKARWLDFLSAESEFMAAGGVSLHGTSAYEGQAALQVRQQIVRITKYRFKVEVGRVIDEASVDYFSAHVAESFIQDTATRDALLFSGFNLGNGVRTTFEIVPGFRAGLAFNAGNPVSNTASLLVGGTFPPFERFYTQPYQQVNQSANNFPDDAFHSMILTPSLLLDTSVIDARAGVQMFDINTNTNSKDDDHIRGYNARGTLRLKFLERRIIPYASTAYTRNDTLVPTNVAVRAPERYHAINVGGGVDVNIARRYKCSHDCADGFGIQYQQVQFQIGDGLVTTNRYFNVGGTIWLAPNLSLGLRFALYNNEAEQSVTPAGVAAGQTKPEVYVSGERSAIAGLRFIMP